MMRKLFINLSHAVEGGLVRLGGKLPIYSGPEGAQR